MGELFLDGKPLDGWSTNLEIDMSNVEERLGAPNFSFNSTLELQFEDNSGIRAIFDDLFRKQMAERDYAAWLSLLNGMGLAVVTDGDEAGYYLAPRVPYRNIFELPGKGWEARPDLSWGARKIEL